jgi:hypothetical protein
MAETAPRTPKRPTNTPKASGDIPHEVRATRSPRPKPPAPEGVTVRFFRFDPGVEELALPLGWTPFAAATYGIYAYK